MGQGAGCLACYFKYELFSRIKKNEGHFVGRLKSTANPTIVAVFRTYKGKPVDIAGKKLQDVLPLLKREVIDVEIEVSFRGSRAKKDDDDNFETYSSRTPKTRETFRLVGILDRESNEYHLYLTSLSPEQLSAEDVALLYRARWSIELIFKELKRLYKLDVITSGAPDTVESLVLVAMLTLVVSHRVLNQIRLIDSERSDRYTPLRWGEGGALPPSQPITSTTGTASVPPAAGGTVYLGTQASVAIPANALNGSQNVTVNVQSVSSPPAPPDGDTLVGAYDFTVNGGGYSFNAPVTLTFTFDPSKIPVGDTPTVEYYDNKTSQWVVVQGTVSGNTIMVTVSHFTTFAVMAVPQTTAASPAPTTTTPITPAVPSFSDVPSSYWGYQAITSLSAKGIVSGYPDGTFKPNNNITRAEFVTMLVKATGLSTTSTSTSFTDITPSDWCYNSVNTAVYAGMVSGMGNGLFAPNAPITREQMVVMVAKAMGNKAPNIDGTELNAFGDESSVSSWAVTGMEKSIKAGIVSGMTANILAPQDNATRSQAAAMIYRLLNVLGK